MPYPNLELTSSPKPLVEHVPTTGDAPQFELTDAQKSQIVVDVIHDGDWIPKEFWSDNDGEPITDEAVWRDYVRERDWGASLVANRVAAQLGLDTFVRVNLARVLMDFGRFPGSTPKNADHLHRFAINYPFSDLLGFSQKQSVLENYYDGVSEKMEEALQGKLVKIAIHTYDQHNPSGTERPATSLMTRSISYQTSSELPAGLFDPMYPDVLAEFTADRILRDRISLTLERAQIPVAHNYPYCLPEGSLEVRYQVWSFFKALQERFCEEYPDTVDHPAYTAVWDMLLDTNLRSSQSDSLRSYLHLYRRAPEGRGSEFKAAAVAYEKVSQFCKVASTEVVDHYRYSKLRASSIAIEVRKDIACVLGPDGAPAEVKWNNINHIADNIARAVKLYFDEDRQAHLLNPNHDIGRHGPWYLQEKEVGMTWDGE